MVKPNPSNKVMLCNENVCLTVYGKEAEMLSSLAAITLICIAIAAIVKTIR